MHLIPYLLLIISILASGCGGQSRKPKEIPTYESCLAQGLLHYQGGCHAGSGRRNAQGRFSLLPNPILLTKLAQPKITVCLLNDGFSPAAVQSIKSMLETSFDVWTDLISDLLPVRTISLNFAHTLSYLDAQEADDLLRQCPADTDMTISLQQMISSGPFAENREHAYPGEGIIVLNGGSDYGTILHEMGHLFGLSDIYIEDEWTCKDGFSNSIMCEHSWNKPVLDDIESVRRSFCLATGGENPSCFNHEKTSILSFLPKAEVNERTLSPGAYFYSRSAEGIFGVGYNILSYETETADGGDEHRAGRYVSTDEKSVQEIFADGSYNLTINTAYFDLKPSMHKRKAVSPETVFLITPNKIRMSVPDHKVSLDALTEDCVFDPGFKAFMESRGIAVKGRVELN